ncbi:hypothetical protein DPEC_G00170870 [Dallia pectoralis]|uniref:Uncharacterized protein n=1 Tax=Dallia pectoralis TaxID=75939 RepID=A0ACC2GDE8_DALPE|nr:hypothetical protein DPEC_G00170870 [Dallia pectoralis]
MFYILPNKHTEPENKTKCLQAIRRDSGLYGLYCNKVIYTKRRICVLKGSSVDISCVTTLSGSYGPFTFVRSSLWFSPKQSGRWKDTLIPEDLITDPEYAGRVEYPDQESRKYRDTSTTLRITDLREEDSAEYRFIFKTYDDFEWGQSSPGTTLTITDLQVNMTPATVTEGQSVTLTCITSCTLTVLTIIIGGRQTSVLTASVGIRVVVLVLIFCLSGFIWFRKCGSKSPSDTTNQTDDGQRDSSPEYYNISDMVMTSTAAQTTDTDNQDDRHYTSIHSSSSKKQEVPLYSNTHMPQELILVPK